MMAQLMRLTRWEWFKLRKRWMPWILLGIAVAMTQLSLWSDYLEYRNIGRICRCIFHRVPTVL